MSASLPKPAIRREAGFVLPASAEPILVGSVLFITALAYFGTLRFPFVYKDQEEIAQNVLVQSWRFLPRYFAGQSAQYASLTGNDYQPLYLIWLRINEALFGLRPAGWHATAVFIHVLAAFLIYQVTRRLTEKPLVAAGAALLFGVHPMRHEVVAWVSGVSESLWSVCFLLAFLSYLRSRDGHRTAWLAASCAFYAAALLSKETAILLPVLVFAHAWIYGKPHVGGAPRGRESGIFDAAKAALSYAPVAIAYGAMRVGFLGGFARPNASMSVSTALATIPSVTLFYLKQWVLPIRVAEFYDLSPQSQFNVIHVLGPTFLLAILLALLWLLRGRLGGRDVSFALAWTVILLLPALAFRTFAPGELVHDRYFYLASFGVSLLVSLALEKLSSGPLVFGLPRLWLLATLSILGLLSYGTANASRYWMDDLGLFEHAYRVAPSNDAAKLHYAITLEQGGDYGTATPLLQEIVAKQPHNALASYALGHMSYEVGVLPPAVMYLERARSDDPLFPETYLELALIDLKRYNLPEAEANLRQGIQLAPLDPTFHFALGITLRHEGNCVASKQELAETLTLKPDFPHVQEEAAKCQPGAATESEQTAPDAQSKPSAERQSAASLAPPISRTH